MPKCNNLLIDSSLKSGSWHWCDNNADSYSSVSFSLAQEWNCTGNKYLFHNIKKKHFTFIAEEVKLHSQETHSFTEGVWSGAFLLGTQLQNLETHKVNQLHHISGQINCIHFNRKIFTSSRSLKRKTSLWSCDSFCLWGLLASGTSNRRQQHTRRLWGTARIYREEVKEMKMAAKDRHGETKETVHISTHGFQAQDRLLHSAYVGDMVFVWTQLSLLDPFINTCYHLSGDVCSIIHTWENSY